MKDIKEYILNEAKDINWYCCFLNKKDKKMLNFNLGEFPKNSLGKKQAEEKIGDPWQKINNDKTNYKYLGILHREQITRKCPDDYEYSWI